MLDSTFEFRISRSAREELAALADSIGVSAADVVRLGIRKMATAHSRKVRRAAPAAPVTGAPATSMSCNFSPRSRETAVPAAAPSLATMDLPALYALRDELALLQSPEAERQYVDGNTEIIIREMRGAPR
jgi:hypothetical protein